MARVKRGVTAHAKHKKVLKAAKGFYGRRKNINIEAVTSYPGSASPYGCLNMAGNVAAFTATEGGGDLRYPAFREGYQVVRKEPYQESAKTLPFPNRSIFRHRTKFS